MSCKTGKFDADSITLCPNVEMCGGVERWHVTLKSGAREDTPMARYAVTKPGTKLGQAVQVDEIVGAECANESEPYILFKVITTHPDLVSPYS